MFNQFDNMRSSPNNPEYLLAKQYGYTGNQQGAYWNRPEFKNALAMAGQASPQLGYNATGGFFDNRALLNHAAMNAALGMNPSNVQKQPAFNPLAAANPAAGGGAAPAQGNAQPAFDMARFRQLMQTRQQQTPFGGLFGNVMQQAQPMMQQQPIPQAAPQQPAMQPPQLAPGKKWGVGARVGILNPGAR